MDIRNLRLFMKIAELGSISSAAQALGMAQPVLSRHLRALETEVGTKLFDRHSKGVTPNANGQKLLEAAQSIDANYKSALRSLTDALGATKGTARIGATPSWLHRLVPTAIARVSATHPAARISVTSAPAETLLNKLLKGQIDFALGPIEIKSDYAGLLDVEPMWETEFTVFAAADHPAVHGGEKPLSELAAMEWALPRHTYARRKFDTVFAAKTGVSPTPRIEVDNPGMVLDVVSESRLLSFGAMPPSTEDTHAHLRRVRCADLNFTVQMGCLTLRKAMLTPLCNLFLKELRATCLDHEYDAKTGGAA
ncbi:LysR family transcriptional regulator [Cognatishimia sp. SS12]|uniref:LysR family transcriptional regulator n=1 Tax=Cognatishimia sp. SS12 TaxID=2979465 RepID=UPI00232CB289|nr:LysR family transcriptional regulator [Cognatishimia sp. SS12]MDC0738924.1 LysR family transcriptional regulator [Cognatishimia sp. SS12]